MPLYRLLCGLTTHLLRPHTPPPRTLLEKYSNPRTTPHRTRCQLSTMETRAMRKRALRQQQVDQLVAQAHA